MSESVGTRKKRKTVQVSARIDPRLKAKLRRWAAEHDLTQSEAVCLAVEELLVEEELRVL